MSKKTVKTKTAKNAKDAKKGGMGAFAWLVTIRPLLPVACVGLLIGAAAYGLEQLKHHAYQSPEFQPSLRFVLVDPPEWVVAEKWEPRILSSISVPEDEPWTDPDLTRRVTEQLESSGWVRRVHRVTRYMDGTIGIQCDCRRPIAMLLTQQGYIPIDQEGVRMPEVYASVGASSGWLRIVGVESPLPQVNEPFRGEDVQAAVRLANLLFEQGDFFTIGISAIDVINFRGRKDKRACHVKLWTPDGTEIKWGSAIGEEVEENTPIEKLAQIAVMLQEGGPRAQVDVSVYPMRTIVPADLSGDGPAGRTRRTSR